MAKEFYFDFGLDPEFRIAQDAASLSDGKSLLHLRSFTEEYGLPGLYDAYLLPQDAGKLTLKEAFGIAASVLRDCYGKVNHVILPADAPAVVNAAAKLMKAYRVQTRIHVVTFTKDGSGSAPTLPDEIDVGTIDECINIPFKNAASAADDAANQDHISVNTAGGAVLSAARVIAERETDRHARYVLFL